MDVHEPLCEYVHTLASKAKAVVASLRIASILDAERPQDEKRTNPWNKVLAPALGPSSLIIKSSVFQPPSFMSTMVPAPQCCAWANEPKKTVGMHVTAKANFFILISLQVCSSFAREDKLPIFEIFVMTLVFTNVCLVTYL